MPWYVPHQSQTSTPIASASPGHKDEEEESYILLIWCSGMNKVTDDQMAQAEKQFKLWESMVNSMTPKERETPELLAKTPSRRRRIARGSGRKDLDVSTMIGQFTAARSMVQNMSKMMKMQGAKGELCHPVQLGAP